MILNILKNVTCCRNEFRIFDELSSRITECILIYLHRVIMWAYVITAAIYTVTLNIFFDNV